MLGEPELVTSTADLDPKIFGIVVSQGARRGLLLPDLEGVDTVAVQLAIALEKAGISPRTAYQIHRFRVERYQ